MNIEIVVCQRGWVLVGNVERDGEELVIKGGSVVRKWGTNEGLGQLAETGPLRETKLDPLPRTTRVHQLTTILRTACNAEKWKEHVKIDG